jgi:hypothetical protein
MGDWPSGKSYSDTLAIAEEARQKEPVDWRTLAPALEALNALTPEDSRLEDLCTAILTSPLPEQIDRHNFTAVMKSLAILAKQKTPQGVALLYDWIDFHRWTDSSSTLSFVTVRGDQQEMAQKTARQMRSAGLDAISRYVELDLAFQILEESRDRSEEEDPSITKRIDDCLITLNQRLEGDASRFNSGDGH